MTAGGPLKHMCFPLVQEPVEQLSPQPARRRSTHDNDNKLDSAVNVSALLIGVMQDRWTLLYSPALPVLKYALETRHPWFDRRRWKMTILRLKKSWPTRSFVTPLLVD